MTLRIPLDPSGSWRDLSPDVPAPIVAGVESIQWPTATHYIEASRHWFDRDRQRAIATAATPADARRMAAKPSFYNFDRERLGTFEDPHMYWRGSWPNLIRRAIHERAMSDVSFVETLVKTSDEHLILDTDEPWIGRPHNGWGRGLMEMRLRLRRVTGAPPLRNREALRSWKRPPWLEHPEIPQPSIGWRMGYGEAYLMEHANWYASLDLVQQERYDVAYPRWPEDRLDLRLDTSTPGEPLSVLPILELWDGEP